MISMAVKFLANKENIRNILKDFHARALRFQDIYRKADLHCILQVSMNFEIESERRMASLPLLSKLQLTNCGSSRSGAKVVCVMPSGMDLFWRCE